MKTSDQGIDSGTFLDAELGLPDIERNIRLKKRGALRYTVWCDASDLQGAEENDLWPGATMCLPERLKYVPDCGLHGLEVDGCEGDESSLLVLCDPDGEWTTETARPRCLSVARTLQFMVYTGLRPAARGADVIPEPIGAMAGHNPSYWHHPRTNSYMFCTEPFEPSPELEAAYDGWGKQYGYHVFKAKWPGMHPDAGKTRLYCFIRDKTWGQLLPRLLGGLYDLMSADVPVWQDPNTGEGWEAPAAVSHEGEGLLV